MKALFGFLALLVVFLTGCSNSWPEGGTANQADSVFPVRFLLDKGTDLKEIVSGNEFVTDLPGVHPVFGQAVQVRVRGIRSESIKEGDPEKAAQAFRQRLHFKRLLEDAESVELRNLERAVGENSFLVWADLYLNGRILISREG